MIGGLAGLNGRFDDDDDESIGRRSAVPCSFYILVHADRLFLGSLNLDDALKKRPPLLPLRPPLNKDGISDE